MLPIARLHQLLFALGMALAAPAFAAPAAAAKPPPPQSVALRVQVGADGKVASASALDPQAVPVLVQAAKEMAGKLSFSPARKDGRAVSSETTMVLSLGFEPKPEGGFGIRLLRAQNGPSVVDIGRARPPRLSSDNGGLVLVGVDLRADGSVDAASFQVEKVELRVPSGFDQAQYEKAARKSLEDTRFILDKVDGVDTPSRIELAFVFNGGPGKRAARGPEDERGEPEQASEPPSLSATSKVAGVELSKIDYTAPEKK
jgi:hypothetical protein